MLLVTRAPLRLILSGEESLGSQHAEHHDSAILMGTIGYHTYSLITPGPARGIRIISSDHGAAYELLSCENNETDAVFGVARAAVCYLNLCDGITVSLASQMPPHPGLGAPNATAIALIKGLAFWSGLDLGAAEVADLAGNVEDQAGSLGVNKQDTYGIALGGLNLVRKVRNRINVEPFMLPPSLESDLEANLMLFLTPPKPTSAESKASLNKEIPPIHNSREIQELSETIRTALSEGDLEGYGQLLHRARLARQRFRAPEATVLEHAYRMARSLGAWGGTVAEDEGGTGTLMLVCPLQFQTEVSKALMEAGLIYRPITFAHEGVELFQTMPWPTAQTWQDLYVNRQEGVMLR